MYRTEDIDERVFLEAQYCIQRLATVREIAKVYCVSKSTVHTDLRKRLPRKYPGMYEEVEKILEYNLSQRHFRGGEATARKWNDKKS